MCGRFSDDAKPQQIEREFKVKINEERAFKTSYNIAQTQIIPIVVETDGERIVNELRWGLIPNWAKDETIGNKLINARAETLAEKPSFRNAFRAHRCIVPASGFYEWKRAEKGAKQPFYFYLKEKD